MARLEAAKRVSLFILLAPVMAVAQQLPILPKMPLVGVFDAGQPGSVIIKLHDIDEGILCYVLMPENAIRQQINGVWTFAGNNVGSISCTPSAKKQTNADAVR